MDNPQETLRILKAARELLSDPERWTRGAQARDRCGRPIDPRGPTAVCFCALGAIWKCGGSMAETSALFDQVITGESIADWNDWPLTTHADVLAAFDRAIVSPEDDL